MGTNKKLSRPPLVPAIPVGMEPKIVEDIEPKFQRETYPDPRYVTGNRRHPAELISTVH
jgi:hypothetical protein